MLQQLGFCVAEGASQTMQPFKNTLGTFSETEENLQGAMLGMWQLIISGDGVKELYVDDVMAGVMGLDKSLSPRETSDYLDAGIYPEDRAMFEAYSRSLLAEGRDEVTYRWNHPTLGLRYFRCGGWLAKSAQGKRFLRGYHQDITELMHQELRADQAIKLMADNYLRISYVDLKQDTIHNLRYRDDIGGGELCYSKCIEILAEQGVDAAFSDSFRRQMAASALLPQLLAQGKTEPLVYYRKVGDKSRWVESQMVAAEGFSAQQPCAVWYVRNITQERQREQELAKIQADLHLQETFVRALSKSLNYSYYVDLENESFEEISLSNRVDIPLQTGKCGQIVGLFLNQVVKPAYRSAMAEFLRFSTVSERIGDGKLISLDYENIWGRWVRVSFLPALRRQNGQITHVLLIGQNIDGSRVQELEEHREVLERNKRLTARNEAIYNQLDVMKMGISGGYAVLLDDDYSTVEYLSESAAQVQGYSAQDLLKKIDRKYINNVYSQDFDRRQKDRYAQLAAGDSYSVKYRVKCSSGRLKWVMECGKRQPDATGISTFQVLLMDIDRTEQTTLLYRRERKQYRDALLHDCDYTFTMDVTTGILDGSFQSKTGENPIEQLNLHIPVHFDELVGKLSQNLKCISKENTGLEMLNTDFLQQTFDSGKRSCDLDYADQRRNRYLRITFLMNRSEETGHIQAIVIARDITIQKEADEAYHKALESANAKLEQAYAEAKLASSAKTDFLARMSHDIRTPINGIIGLLDMCDRYPEDVNWLVENRVKARNVTNHLLSLVNDVLDMSKLESGNVDLGHEVFNLAKLVRQCQEMVTPQISQRRLKSENLAVPKEEDCWVIGSPLHVRQILMNLISNAIKYNVEGGTILGGCTLKEHRDGYSVFELEIADTGIGMSPEFVKHVFEPFSQENQGSGSGTGLGMSIVKKLVDRMGGKIQVESEKGRGSRFLVTLPLLTDENCGADIPVRAQAAMDIGGTKILAAEDNELNREIITFMLQEAGAAVDVAENGQQAVEKFCQSVPGYYDLILMDVMMPVLDGLDATRHIRKLPRPDAKTIPILAMTANAFSEDVEKCLDAGMNDHMAKPLDSVKVLATISSWLRK